MTLMVERPVEAPVQAPAKTPAEILEHAALIIEERGWCQRTATDPDGRACAVGAIHLANGKEDVLIGIGPYESLWDENSQQALDVLRDVTEIEPMFWNDEQGRTQAEVVSALRAAAEMAR